nr:hypothetical protein Iba_chr08bCG9570 [Ipomoea batatas]
MDARHQSGSIQAIREDRRADPFKQIRMSSPYRFSLKARRHEEERVRGETLPDIPTKQRYPRTRLSTARTFPDDYALEQPIAAQLLKLSISFLPSTLVLIASLAHRPPALNMGKEKSPQVVAFETFSAIQPNNTVEHIASTLPRGGYFASGEIKLISAPPSSTPISRPYS